MDGMDASNSVGLDSSTLLQHQDDDDPSAFETMLAEARAQAAAASTLSEAETPAAGLAARAGIGVLGPVLGAVAGGAALLVPTNRQSESQTASVTNHPELSARITRAPGDLSGEVTLSKRGADGASDTDLGTLTMDAQGRLLAPGSGAESGKVVGQANRDGSVTLTPDLTASRAPRGIGQADPGGAGNKPPPNVGSVRPDGECDENANVGATSARARLPRNGHWTDPTKPGNSGWMSDDPQVNAITGGQPIQFVNGRPDLTPWSKMSVNFQPGELTGNDSVDRRKVIKSLDASNNPDVQAAGSADSYLDQNNLTHHHATDTCMQLVPEALNRLVPHIGSASDLRYQSSQRGTP